MGSVSLLNRVHPPDTELIKRPVGSNPKDKFTILLVEGDGYNYFAQGTVLVFVLGEFRNGSTHLLERGDGARYPASLVMIDEKRVRVQSFHEDEPSGEVDFKSLNIVGRLWEYYLADAPDQRCVMWDESWELTLHWPLVTLRGI